MNANHYIIDTCSLVDLNKHNPIDVFPSVWKRLSLLVNENLLHSPIEVLYELQKQDDQIATWSSQHKKMFIPESPSQIVIVREIMEKYPALVDIDKEYSADPWLIAVAYELVTNVQKTMYNDVIIIVTEETLRGDKVKIPFVCQKYQLACINLVEMFRKEGWRF